MAQLKVEPHPEASQSQTLGAGSSEQPQPHSQTPSSIQNNHHLAAADKAGDTTLLNGTTTTFQDEPTTVQVVTVNPDSGDEPPTSSPPTPSTSGGTQAATMSSTKVPSVTDLRSHSVEKEKSNGHHRGNKGSTTYTLAVPVPVGRNVFRKRVKSTSDRSTNEKTPVLDGEGEEDRQGGSTNAKKSKGKAKSKVSSSSSSSRSTSTSLLAKISQIFMTCVRPSHRTHAIDADEGPSTRSADQKVSEKFPVPGISEKAQEEHRVEQSLSEKGKETEVKKASTLGHGHGGESSTSSTSPSSSSREPTSSSHTGKEILRNISFRLDLELKAHVFFSCFRFPSLPLSTPVARWLFL
ncbi:hypothetical protein C8Q75DRAFT_808254 [Abortiporus biennis]|nr:hypothetical protein C8Q75DRAFT_808254 [Abortiporus biennis]